MLCGFVESQNYLSRLLDFFQTCLPKKVSFFRTVTRHMAYPGGKAQVKRHILAILNSPLFDGWEYGEFFFGMGHVGSGVTNKSLYHFSDLSPRLIALHEAVQRAGVKALPGNLSKKEYERLRVLDRVDAKSAAAAFLYTWQGKEWAGTATSATGDATPRHASAISPP